MRVLLVEDDSATSGSISQVLQYEGYVCVTRETGMDGLEAAKLHRFDVIVLDLMLPDIAGCDVLRRLRALDVQTPVMVLSGLSDVDLKLEALSGGADDCLTKPFARAELIARLQAITRRARSAPASVLRSGRLTIDYDSLTARVDDLALDLTIKEYGVLEVLCRRKGRVLTKQMLLDHLYAGKDEPVRKIIDVFVCRLRKKLTLAPGCEDYIETVHGQGYRFRVPDQEERGAERAAGA